MKKMCFGRPIKAKLKTFKNLFLNQQQTFTQNYALQLKDNIDYL